ncbi:signal peptidase II [Ilumatobacter nonamiensis]|uniref:signal peptidase II n=1 Tax=Ilumatobacter nonamiensis TaxID=467093 RepID=UPI000349F730|nr:signal peptidase II [Ilumatobacter nonamiensis]
MPDHSATGNLPAGDAPSPSFQQTAERRPWAPVAAAIVALAGVDLVSKRWATAALADAPVELPGPVDLQLAYNSGTAFGLFSQIPTIAVSIVVIAFLIAVLKVWGTHRAPTVPVVLIVAGGLANTLDRFEAGSVVDMLHTGWWPTFNLADVFITIGVAYWIIASRPLRAA